MGLPPKNFVKIEASPPKNSIFFYSTPKEIINFHNLPLENFMVPQPVEGGGGVRILNAIAHFATGSWFIESFMFVDENNYEYEV